jgi:hypothetical protein
MRDSILGEASGVGTPLYMAPEQWRSLAGTGAPVDVYAFGLILFELVAGEHPFDLAPARRRRYLKRVTGALARLLDAEELSGEVARHVLAALHEEVVPLDLREVSPDTPAALAELVARCLAKDPRARPSISEARAALLAQHLSASGSTRLRAAAPALPSVEASESNRACSYVVMADVPGAIAILDAFLARQPDAVVAWINRTALAINEGERSGAASDAALAAMLSTLPAQVASAPAVAGFEHDIARWVARRAAGVAAFSPDGERLAGADVTDSGSVCWTLDRGTGAISTTKERRLRSPATAKSSRGGSAPEAGSRGIGARWVGSSVSARAGIV